MSKSKFFHTLSEYKNIFALEQRAFVLSFVKNVAFLLGHPVDFYRFYTAVNQQSKLFENRSMCR